MRRVLIDRARTKRAARHGGGCERVDLDTIDARAQAGNEMLFRFNEAHEDLSREDDKAAEIVKLRLFTGMSIEEAISHARHARVEVPRGMGLTSRHEHGG